MGMQKIKKGDTVSVIAGKDKGRTGVVLRVVLPKNPVRGLKVVVEGVNIVKKHTKPDPSQEKPGGIIEKELPIHISNVAILNTTTNKIDGVAFKKGEDGRKIRVYKSNAEALDV